MAHIRVIGLSGVSGCGKDTFFELLHRENPKIQRFALADELKRELYTTYLDLYKVDIFSCTREIKNLMRPLMVAHGLVRRNMSLGKYWTQKLEPKILDYLDKDPENIACVTDVRYDVFKEDELFWLKSKMKGSLAHIQMSDASAEAQSRLSMPAIVMPANIDEAINDPKLLSAADYRFVWARTPDANKLPDYSKLSIYAEKFLSFINR